MPVGIRRLVGFVALCDTCHSAKHAVHCTRLRHQRWENYWNWEQKPDGEWAEFRRSRPLPVAPGEKLKAELERQEEQRKMFGDHRQQDALRRRLRRRFYKEEAAKPPSERRSVGDNFTWSLECYRVELEERGGEAGEEARRWLENLDRRFRRTPLEHFVEVNRHVSLGVLEAHIFEVQRMSGEVPHAEWRADYNGFDRL